MEMDRTSQLCKKISDLTALLALMFDRAPVLEKRDEVHTTTSDDVDPTSSISAEYNIAIDDEETENINETDFEKHPATEEAALDDLKGRALDRLSEVLARFKSAKGPRTSKVGNLGAKHVASVVMVEDTEAKRVTLYFSKNEGLDTVDKKFLDKLKELLEDIAKDNNHKNHQEGLDRVFDIIFNHQVPRIEVYSKALGHELRQASQRTEARTLTTASLEQHSQHPIKSREWEDNHGHRFSYRPGTTGEATASIRPISCRSDSEDSEAVAKVFRELQSLFGSEPYSFKHLNRAKVFLKDVYNIIRYPRQRPALKNLLRQALHGYEPAFRKAWGALLYLTRIYYAAETIVDLATKAKSFAYITFAFVPPDFMCSTKVAPNGNTPSDVLKGLNLWDLPKSRRDIFLDEKNVRKYMERSHQPRSVHAEVQLMIYLKTRLNSDLSSAKTVFPYIGCSKKCCFFCEAFRLADGDYAARGTHEAVFSKWGLPSAVTTQAYASKCVQVLAIFAGVLEKLLWDELRPGCSLSRGSLLQQSSAALSTAQAERLEKSSYSVRPSTDVKLMFPSGFSACEGQMRFAPYPGRPGYALFLAPDMPKPQRVLPIEVAEECKINHDRSSCFLEKLKEMPKEGGLQQKLCRLCQQPAKSRCSRCWTSYCSRICQRKDWMSHVFTCRVPSRPNDTDYLRLTVKSVNRVMLNGGSDDIQNALLKLFADDHICRSFGFNNCLSWFDAMNLVCLYNSFLSALLSPVKTVQAILRTETLGEALELYCRQHYDKTNGNPECDCISWFLQARKEETCFPIAKPDQESYLIWNKAWLMACNSLDLKDRIINGAKFTPSETQVFKLLVRVQPSLWQPPDVYSSAWIDFGFCFCKTHAQRRELASAYLALAASDARFEDIVAGYETSTLEDLMLAHGIDISNLTRHGIRPTRPDECQYSVYRFMAEVEHAVSGRYCNCFRMRPTTSCHKYFETHLDSESDTGYGFHLTSSWGRWQLLNFYKYLFRRPGFDAKAMGEAKESGRKGALEEYIDTRIPGMRRQILNKSLAESIFFPRLDGRLSFSTTDGVEIPHFHLQCDCVIHDVVGPPGVCLLELGLVVDVEDMPADSVGNM